MYLFAEMHRFKGFIPINSEYMLRKGNGAMKNEWGTRDWKWLVGVLIGIILLILSGWIMKIPNITTYLSILGTGASIALAFIAIYISLSQNNNSQMLNVNTMDLLVRINEKVGNDKAGSVNEKVTSANPREIAALVQTNVNAALDNFSQALFSRLKKSGINQGFIERFKKEVAAQIVINSLVGSVNVTNPKNLTVDDQVNNVLETIKDKTFSESVGIINTTALSDQARQQLYRSLVDGDNKKDRDGNDDLYEALFVMYSDDRAPAVLGKQ